MLSKPLSKTHGFLGASQLCNLAGSSHPPEKYLPVDETALTGRVTK